MLSADNVIDSIVKTEFKRIGKRTTVCLLTLSFGMEVVGVSHCQDPSKFNVEFGENAAYDDAFNEAFSLCLAHSSALGKGV